MQIGTIHQRIYHSGNNVSQFNRAESPVSMQDLIMRAISRIFSGREFRDPRLRSIDCKTWVEHDNVFPWIVGYVEFGVPRVGSIAWQQDGVRDWLLWFKNWLGSADWWAGTNGCICQLWFRMIYSWDATKRHQFWSCVDVKLVKFNSKTWGKHTRFRLLCYKNLHSWRMSVSLDTLWFKCNPSSTSFVLQPS